MPEVTDSYCERCGSRYVFNPTAPIGLSLKGARVLARGLKNFVMTDGQSMSDSIAMARNENEHQDSSRITEAFHRTFNFCLTCRQYACDRCWNAKTGACLSCSPEVGQVAPPPRELLTQQRRPLAQQLEPRSEPQAPAAPREPGFNSPAASNWEADWSLFAESASAESETAQAAPTGFNEPIILPEPTPTAPTAPAAPRPTVAPEWPVSDLPTGVPVASSGSGGKNGRRSRKQADIDAASLWPLADEISPEMTLTAEELELVENRLGQGEAPDEAIADQTPEATIETSQPQPVAEPELPIAATTRWVEDEADSAAEQFVLAEPAEQKEAPEWGSAWRTASPSSWDMQPVSGRNRGPASVPTYSTETQQVKAAAQFEPTLPTEEPTQAQHLLSLPHPSLAEISPAPRTEQRSPLVARLLGHKGPSRNDRPDVDAWPHVTKWSERPVKSLDWIDDTLTERAEQSEAAEQSVPEAEPVEPIRPFFSRDPREAPITDQEPSPTPGPGYGTTPPPVQNAQEVVDARSAAAVRLSAVSRPELAPTDPTTQPPAETPPWPAADQDVIDAAAHRHDKAHESRREPVSATSRPIPPAPIVTAAVSPASWPPLGASWPAPQSPGAPWPGPEATPVPAVVASQSAQAADEPTLAEMWEQSSQEVLNRGTVRVCLRCALPVSTQARFCRRCGTRQA